MAKTNSAAAAAACDRRTACQGSVTVESADVKLGVVASPNGVVIPAQLKFTRGELKSVLCPDKDGTCQKKKSMYLEDGQVVKVCVDVGAELMSGAETQPENMLAVKLYQRPPSAHFNTRTAGAGTGAGAGRNEGVAAAQGIQTEDVLNFLKGCRDEDALKLIKKNLNERLKTVLGGKPQKSYQVKMRNGRRYVYEVWWDPVSKKKVMEYYGRNLPGEKA